jgi:hypothetical protein
LDYAEALWRCGRKAEARKALGTLRPKGEHEVRQVLDQAAPAVWVHARERYLPDFSLALLGAQPAKAKAGRYWLHLAQAYCRVKPAALVPLLRTSFAKGRLAPDVELKEALEAMPRGKVQKEALKLFEAAKDSL